ncbi:MAG: VWA domain-containing protein [Acidobacteriota bacterium]
MRKAEKIRNWTALPLTLAMVLPIPGQSPERRAGGDTSPSPGNTGREQQPINIRTNEVRLDVVVTDRKGRPIRGLVAEDFEIEEDGTRQLLTAFQPVSDQPVANRPDGVQLSGARAGSGANEPGIEFEGRPAHHLVTMLFDHLPVQRVQAVRDAAFQFIDNSVAETMEVRVMTIGRQLYLIENFTNNKALLRRAIEVATSTVEKSHAERSQEVESRLRAEVKNGEGSRVKLAQLSLETLEGSTRMASEVKSPHHIFSLIPFARAHRLMPGRKMALYFSDGLYLPPGMGQVIRNAIDESTRAGLSFYSINIRDLLVGAGNQVSRLETSTVINQTRRSESAGFSTDNANSFNAYRISDRASTNFNTFEYIDRRKELSKQGPLSELTEGTGGFLIRNSNDLNGSLKRIGAEMGNYYALSYLPSRQEADGRFRNIAVRVKRNGAVARTRQGYFALPPSKRERPELSYETPLLAALNGNLAPHDFPLECGAFRFESREGRRHIAVNAAIRLAPLIHEEDREQKAFPVSFAVLGLIRDESGEIVQQFSEPHELAISSPAIEEARRTSFNLSRHFWLPEGRYTLEFAVHDQRAGRFSTERQPLHLDHQVSGPLQTGDLLLVSQVDELDPAAVNDPDHPLISGQRRIVPALSSQFAQRELKEISFTLPIFLANGSAPALKIELMKGEQLIAATSPDLPAPDPAGRILFTAGIGTAGLGSGSYQLRATLTRGEESREEVSSFVITGEGGEKPAEKPEEVIASALVAADRIGELTLHALKTIEPARLSIDELLRDVRVSGERMYDQIGQYTYSLRKVRRTLNGKGQIRQEEFQDFEAYPVNGHHALIKFSDNGSRLAVQLIELNRRVATDLLVKSSNESSTETSRAKTGQIGYWGASLDGLSQRRGEKRQWRTLTIDPEIFFEVCQFSAPRMAMLEGRPTIVVDFNPHGPNPGSTLAPDRQWIHRLTGTMWIDLVDKALVRIEGQRQQSGSSLVNFVYQQQMLAPGVWAPSLIRLNSGGDETLFDGLNWDAWFEFSQFKRFDTSGIEEKIGRQD